ncbi:uridine kinase [Dactylosporangium sp. NBC_01737]|uniref:uridine kinase n=1 Tax=Dactylosporangium sp. NBC_01737 TaxID=2975959 RepID=UPI002E164F67|nr:uridine kinase [Dactylosporangium sp. NBC_01737]
MKARPVTVGGLAADIAARVELAHATRVAVDGAPTSGADVLAERVVEQLRADGGHAVHIRAGGFLRAASLRLERGRTNPDAYYEDWLDLRAVTREVLTPAKAGGTGRVLPSLWDPVTDRATRAPYVQLPAGGIVVLSGTMLLGAGLDFDVTVHLTQSAAAIARRTPPEMQWTLPAFQRYHDEVMPQEYADIVVRADDPRHPALVL